MIDDEQPRSLDALEVSDLLAPEASAPPPPAGARGAAPYVIELPPDDGRPYADAEEHLRDEVWGLWLRLEHEIRRRWERGALPRGLDERSLGVWGPGELGGLFRLAYASYAGEALVAEEHGADRVRELQRRHSTAVGRRVEASLLAGVRLPLVEIARAFRLTPRQRDVLACAVLPEIDPDLLVAYRYLGHDPQSRGLDGRLLAFLLYESAAARAQLAQDLSPRSPLVWYRLLEIDEVRAGDPALLRRIRPASRLVQLLGGGVPELDPALREVARLEQPPTPAEAGLFSDELLERAVSTLRSDGALLVLRGQRGAGRRLLVRTAAARLGRPTLHLDGAALLSRPVEAARLLVRALAREALLFDAVLILPEVDTLAPPAEQGQLPALVSWLCAAHPRSIALTLSSERVPRMELRPAVHVQLGVPSLRDRAALWARAVRGLDGAEADELAGRFAITGGLLDRAARSALAAAGDALPDVEALAGAVRDQLDDRLSRLGRAVERRHGFDDLVIDEDVTAVLREILAAVRERRRVREEWGLRGAAGVSVLFSGDPGVGKTMSASVIARELGLSLFEIDLSQVTSKWLGETEKNLAELFDAAEPGHAVLLFNEADSLFGRRTTDVKSANDRYANLETNYLLQRLERFNGLSILTTNLGKAIDPAFRRRFAYDVQFTFPTADMRAELWRRSLPAAALDEGVDFEQLGRRFELSGGFIKVAAERAAFLAAHRGLLIEDDILTDAVERMYRERGKLTAHGRLE